MAVPWASTAILSSFTQSIASATEIWVTDKVISEGAEHDQIVELVNIQVSPNNHLVVTWSTTPPSSYGFAGYSAEFDLQGNRLRALMSLQPTGGVQFSSNLRCAISTDSSTLAYVWTSEDWADTTVYRETLWFQTLDYLSGNPLISPVRLDTSDSYPFNSFADHERVEYVSDSIAIVYWREQSSGVVPEYSARFLQRVTSSGQVVGDRIDLYSNTHYLCDSVDTCRTVSTQYELEFLADSTLLVVLDGGAYLGGPFGNVYSLGRIVDAGFEPLPGVDVLMCEGLPCTIFTGYWAVSQFPDVARFPSGGFAVSVNIGYDVDVTSLVAGRAFDSLFRPSSPAMGASDHNPREPWISPDVACAPNDEYVVVWTDRGESGNAFRDVWAQRFHRSGTAIGVNQRLNGIVDLASGNSAQFDAVYVDGHLVVAHYGMGKPVGVVAPSYLLYPLILQVMPWDKVGFYSPGDVDQSGDLTSADIIQTVNYVFKSGRAPKPQSWAGDVDSNCIVTAADIIYSVNHVFKQGPAPVSDCSSAVPYVPDFPPSAARLQAEEFSGVR